MTTHAYRSSVLGACLLSLLGFGCTATAGDPAARPGSPPNLPGADPTASPSDPGSPGATPPSPGSTAGPGAALPPPPSGAVMGQTMLRRLTNLEYRNTLRVLLNLPATPDETAAESDPLTGGFDNLSSSLMVSPSLGARYADTARNLAQAFSVPTCAGDEMACATGFITEFGKRAYRRPLAASEVAEYESLYADQRTRTDYVGGIRQVVQTILQSPYVLYRSELGVGGAVRTLTPYEVATQLAYMLTASPPDEALLAAADGNALATPAALEAEARRLLALPEARVAVRRLLGGYVGVLGLNQVNKDADVYPSFTPSLRASMQTETDLFIDSVVFEGDGTLRSLFTAPHSLVNGELAALYGLGGSGATAEFARATFNSGERMGILTHASVLSVEAKPGSSDPVKRGKFVRVNLLCGNLPPPPAIVPEIAPPAPNLTTRERFAQHSSDPACAGCHSLIDPIGFGLENYDGIGQYRTQENGIPIDAAGVITGTQDMDGPFQGGVELATKLGASLEAGQCLTRKAYRWAFGRVENDHEQPVIQSIAAPLGPQGFDIREVLVGVIKSDNFTYRTFR